MANAFQHFAQGIARLTDEANELRNERASIEQQIALLGQRRKEIIVRIANIEQESFVSADRLTLYLSQRAYTSLTGHRKSIYWHPFGLCRCTISIDKQCDQTAEPIPFGRNEPRHSHRGRNRNNCCDI